MKKNVILIETDQQRYDCLGCNDNPYIKTPNIDALAADGTVFTRHIAANPVCQPSRCSLFTGLYPPGHGVYTNGIALNRNEYINSHNADGLIFEPLTMADAFAKEGYATASFGKLHLTPNIEYDSREHKCPVYPESYGEMAKEEFRDWHGPYYGFDYVDFTAGHGEIPALYGHYAFWLKDTAPELHKEVYPYGNPYHTKAKPEDRLKLPLETIGDLYPSKIPSELHNTTWLADRFVSYLNEERPKDKPFFTYVGFPDPHHPYTPSYDIMEQFEGCEVKPSHDPESKGMEGHPSGRKPGAVDDEFLRYTYAMMYQVDMAVGKIVEAVKAAGLYDETIFVFTSDHGDFLGDHGLQTKAQFGSHALLNVPFVMRVPGSDLPARCDAPMSNVDVMPTLLSCAGCDTSNLDVHGIDITQAMGETSRQVYAYAGNCDKDSFNYTVYDERYRYTWFPDSNDWDELFDHQSDIGESTNLASKSEYRELIGKFRASIKDALFEHNHPMVGRITNF